MNGWVGGWVGAKADLETGDCSLKIQNKFCNTKQGWKIKKERNLSNAAAM